MTKTKIEWADRHIERMALERYEREKEEDKQKS